MRHTRRASGLYAAEYELPQPRGARQFLPPFGAPFRAAIATPGGAAVPWYLSGGIAAANCVAAYQPKGAASLAASYVNLANPGTYDLAPGVAPTFDAATGWTFDGATKYIFESASPKVTDNFSLAFYGVPNTAGLSQSVLWGTRSAGNNGWSWSADQYNFQQKLGYTIVGVADYTSTLATPTTAAFMGLTVSGTTAILYLGTSKSTLTVGSITAPSLTGMIMGAVLISSTLYGFYKETCLASSRYNLVLSDAQMSALAVAMAAL